MADVKEPDKDRLKLLRPLGLGLLVGVFVFLLSEILIHLEQSREYEAARSRLQIETSAMRARLESELNSTFSVGLSAASLVAAKPDFSAHDYERLAQTLATWHPGLRNIALAPDNVVRYVYPLAGNEAVLGVNLETVPDQREGVLLLRKDWKPFLAGPINLLQGGVGFVHRVPVIVVDAGNSASYWGLVSIAMDTAPVFEKVGLNRKDEVVYALRGRDGKGVEGDVFFGDEGIFTSPTALQMSVIMPGGRWQLAADWREPGRAMKWRTLLWHVLALLLSFCAGGLVAFAARSQERLQVLASHDSLTGLANRHQFLLQAESFLALAARQKYPFTLLNLDLEGFKGINDDYGHEVGDAMLVHVAAQARECLRTSDLIARFGGDEFLVLLPDTQPGPVLDQLIARLREAVAKSLVVKGHVLSVSISVGVASYPDDGFSLSELMRVSDFNMYADKRLRKRDGECD
ncbi:MAG: diguanylate cyclase [Moraxellaceae bacterium]